jgi:Kef-type K+ transport system membrane component KefB
MTLESNDLIILFSTIIILSYFFNFVAGKIKIPSVLLLLLLGMSLKMLAHHNSVSFHFPRSTLELMGTFGLILIVLEASLDLNIHKEELPLIRNSFLAALVILFVSALSIAFILYYWKETSFKKALINAIPLAVVSSAIAIPSVALLPKRIKEFIVYEATFSDILGIMLFYYVIQNNLLDVLTLGNFTIKMIIILLVSLAGSLLLLFLIARINNHIKSFLILAILILIYSTGKIFHLPSLLLILVFGLLINNFGKLINEKTKKILQIDSEKLQTEIIPFKTLTEESAFLVRTFFFVLFGYSINLSDLSDPAIIFSGLIILSVSLLIRYIYLRFTVKETDRITKLFLAPRGLITVVLFYSIPEQYIIPEFSIGIVFVVIISSGLMMAISLWTSDSKDADSSARTSDLKNK